MIIGFEGWYPEQLGKYLKIYRASRINNIVYLSTILRFITSKFETSWAVQINQLFFMKTRCMELFRKDPEQLRFLQRTKLYSLCFKERLIEQFRNTPWIKTHQGLTRYLLLYLKGNPPLNLRTKLLFRNSKSLIWLVQKELRKLTHGVQLYLRLVLSISLYLI
jgi:hypothetical protein